MVKFEKDMKMGIQGDVAFTRIDVLPEGLVPAEVDKETGNLVVAHSETGHHHAFDASSVLDNDVVLLQNPENPLEAYLQVNKPTALKHHRSFDPHQTVLFESGLYRINRQREHTPEGFRAVQD